MEPVLLVRPFCLNVGRKALALQYGPLAQQAGTAARRGVALSRADMQHTRTGTGDFGAEQVHSKAGKSPIARTT